MILKDVIHGNSMQWDNKKRPFYENYYFKCADPDGNWSLWVRYTLTAPTNKQEQAIASLWGIFYSKSKKYVTLKKTYAIEDIELHHRDIFIQVGSGLLSADRCEGMLENSNHQIAWELEFEDPTLSYCLYPSNFFYKGKIPKSKFVEPRVLTHVTGKFMCDGETFTLNHHPAHQAHVWGTQYSQTWAWGNCVQFKEDPTAVFEGASSKIKIGPWTSPFLNLFYLRVDGIDYEMNGITKWTRNKSEFDLLSWKFEAVLGSKKFVGEITRWLDQIVGLKYTGPNAEVRYCYNATVGDMKLEVFNWLKGEWMLDKTLTSKACTFEMLSPEADSRVETLL